MKSFELVSAPARAGAALRHRRLFHPIGVLAHGRLDRTAPLGRCGRTGCATCGRRPTAEAGRDARTTPCCPSPEVRFAAPHQHPGYVRGPPRRGPVGPSSDDRRCSPRSPRRRRSVRSWRSEYPDRAAFNPEAFNPEAFNPEAWVLQSLSNCRRQPGTIRLACGDGGGRFHHQSQVFRRRTLSELLGDLGDGGVHQVGDLRVVQWRR